MGQIFKKEWKKDRVEWNRNALHFNIDYAQEEEHRNRMIDGWRETVGG